MENKSIKNFNPIIMIAALLQIIFVIVAVISIKQILESNQPTLEVEVTGLTSEIDGLKESNKRIIEYSVYQAISINSPGSNIDKTGVDIREGSLINKYYEKANIHYANFIADVPNAKQSYQVAYIWSEDELNRYVSPDAAIAVTCLPQDQLIYGDFDCNHNRDYMKQDMITMILKALSGKPKADSDVILDVESTSSSDYKIKISYALCDSMCICKLTTEDGKQQALEEYDEFISGLGYNPNDITHYFYNCENEERYLNENNVIEHR